MEQPAAARKKQAQALLVLLEKVLDGHSGRTTKRNSKAWKGLERLVAEELRGERVLRGANFAIKDVDVKNDFAALQIDAKFRARHGHHKFMREIERKYCKRDGDVPVLITKEPGQASGYVVIPLRHYALLLDVLRIWSGSAPYPELQAQALPSFVKAMRFDGAVAERVAKKELADLHASFLRPGWPPLRR